MTVPPSCPPRPGAGPESPAQRPAITALTGIRALAACWVVLHHFAVPILDLLPGLRFAAPLLRSGFLGVEVFFVLSGFIIAYNYSSSLDSMRSYQAFLWARVARIYPVHMATLLAMGALVVAAALAGVPLNSEARNTVANFVGNVVMLQAVPGLQGVNVPSWSVSCEAVAYIVFPVLVWLTFRLSARRSLIWACLVLAGGIGAIQIVGLGTSQGTLSYPVMWIRISVEFTVGVLLWSWWRFEERSSRGWDVAAMAGLSGTLAVCYSVDPASPRLFFALPFVGLFVISCASATGIVHRFLSTGLMQWGGRVSYSLYMTHYMVFLVTKKLFHWQAFESSPLLVRSSVVAAWVILVLGAAVVSFYLVEEPGRRFMKSRRPRPGLSVRLAGRRATASAVRSVTAQTRRAS